VFRSSLMAIHKVINQPGVYFITFTCYKWLNLIGILNSYDLVYKFFRVLEERGHNLLAYVIMPNHVHFILQYNNSIDQRTLNLVIGSGKRFIAYEFVLRAEKAGMFQLLEKLRIGISANDLAKRKKHYVWEESFDVKECRTEKFLMQKLSYIHSNPMAGKWKLCSSVIEYPHSSAQFYITGIQACYPVKDYQVAIAECYSGNAFSPTSPPAISGECYCPPGETRPRRCR
jgi:REP element-mobilizing transposase RayT